MKKIFLDTNVLIDLIADRKPFSKSAIQIFDAAERKQVALFTSSHSIATAYYVLKKYVDDRKLREILLGLFDFLTVLPVDADVLKKGLRSKYKDFEDSIQIFCSTKIEQMDCIVTRNIKDFKGSELPVYAPDELMSKI
jgi:predicted nucleic acid-binding protein